MSEATVEPMDVGHTGTQYVHYNLYQPSVAPEAQNNFVGNFIEVSNQTSDSATGQLIVYQQDGRSLATVNGSLSGSSRKGISIHDIVASTQTQKMPIAGVVAWFTNDASQQYLVTLSRYYYSKVNMDATKAKSVQFKGTTAPMMLQTMMLESPVQSTLCLLQTLRMLSK